MVKLRKSGTTSWSQAQNATVPPFRMAHGSIVLCNARSHTRLDRVHDERVCNKQALVAADSAAGWCAGQWYRARGERDR
eukprot:scaffold33549_cov72-Phaeocystis_antarctica.AAC.7